MIPMVPRITDPESIPVVGIDDHLAPIDEAVLDPQALRERFAVATDWTPEWPGDGLRFIDREPAAAAVLVPLVMRPTGLQVLLTRRTDHLRAHAGQISFPGGRAEPEDADAAATALRETEEEIGLDRGHLEIIGSLPTYTTVTSFVVTPVIALVRPGFTLTLDSFEVAEAFEVPLRYLMTPAHHRRHEIVIAGQVRRFLSMPWSVEDAVADPPQSYFIWGATAAMLRNFYRFLAS
jgi:8-oxo-dGTP pyrophosphatase MutT (NUDIX family)